MRKIPAPPLNFRNWRTWDDRHSIGNAKYPGVYILAITRKNLSGSRANVEDACYIGMTNNQKGLAGRWYQFDRAIHGKRGHSGGNTVYAELGHYSKWNKRLYVAAVPVPCNTRDPSPKDYILMGVVAFLEYAAFAKFRRMRSKRSKPEFNTR